MLKLGAWHFDPTTRRLLRGREERKLTLKAAGVLLALAETPGQVWSRDALLERAWAGVTVGEEVLTHAVAELRRALGDDAREPRFIETVHKSGYRLLATPYPASPLADEAASDLDDDGLGLEVYASYFSACDLFDRGGRKNMAAAVALFAEVLRSDPTFAPAHAGLAKALTFLDTYYESQAGTLERALSHATAARRIQPALADAYAAEGLIFTVGGDFARGARRFGVALRLNPEAAETHYLVGRACLAEGKFALAAAMLERAATLRVDDYHAAVIAGKVRQKTGEESLARANYARALPRAEARLAVHPGDYRALCTKARSLWQLGRKDEAMTLMERVAEHPDPMNYHLACTFARAGQSKRALDVLEQVVELGWRHPAWLGRDPDFDALRETPRFKRIAKALGA